MGIFDLFRSSKTAKEEVQEEKTQPENLSLVDTYGPINRRGIYYDTFDGEKTPGELGNIYDTLPDHLALRMRSYDMELKVDIIKIITGKFFKWILGSGLSFQAEPNQEILNLYGVNFDIEGFKKKSEALFRHYMDSKYSDYNRNDNFHKKVKDALRDSFLGGDCLFIARFDDYGPNIQVIDGEHIVDPIDDTGKGKGNKIKNGVEINKRGEHVAFWIKKEGDDLDLTHDRIKAQNKEGDDVAWMLYGTKHRINHTRGISEISSILEKTAKLDRFTEASVSKAEQVANVPYFFEHDASSTGEDPLSDFSSKRTIKVDGDDPFEEAGRTAAKVTQTTSNSVFNLPIGTTVKGFNNESETNFDVFYRSVFNSLCAAIDIPPEVALQLYEQNYSSSRAAINTWEFILEIRRKDLAEKSYKKFYKLWLKYNFLKDNIDLPGYGDGDHILKDAFTSCRFTGRRMPHIDPLKEIKAIREMLGVKDPLISREQAAEMANAGDWEANAKKFLSEDNVIPEDRRAEINPKQGNNAGPDKSKDAE
tara:strand:- start:4598 stop:6199 length:1602 start_codon:yes stop_codon:yes gene_type:complete